MVEILLCLDTLSFWDFEDKFAWMVLFLMIAFELKRVPTFLDILENNKYMRWRSRWVEVSRIRGCLPALLGPGTLRVNSLCPSCSNPRAFSQSICWQLVQIYIYFFSGSLNTFGKGENIYTPMHGILSGLLGFVNRLNEILIHFSVLLANIYK